MADLSTFTTDEMVDDWYASRSDAETCEKAIALDVDYPDLEYRATTNRKIMAMIEEELERRGELSRIGKGENE